MFTSSIKREIRHFHVVVVQWRQRNAQKSVMQVQSCCFANLTQLLFCRSRCRSRCRRRRLCLSSLMAHTEKLRLKGVPFSGLRFMETVGICWSILKDREFCHFGRWKRPKGLIKRSVFFLFFFRILTLWWRPARSEKTPHFSPIPLLWTSFPL